MKVTLIDKNFVRVGRKNYPINSLPKDLNVDEDLDLEGCTSLTSLPEGLKVEHSIYLPRNRKKLKGFYLNKLKKEMTLEELNSARMPNSVSFIMED